MFEKITLNYTVHHNTGVRNVQIPLGVVCTLALCTWVREVVEGDNGDYTTWSPMPCPLLRHQSDYVIRLCVQGDTNWTNIFPPQIIHETSTSNSR